ncbi:glycosyltransferase family 2 protein [Geopseudomonas aromaticivorans]
MGRHTGLKIHPARNRPERPLLSICIPNFNGADYISQCIESALNQEFPHEIEIIVHDDASTDESIAIIVERHPNVKILVSESNVGFCISNNRMVEHARGKYILLLNNDAILRPGSFSAFLAKAERSSKPSIIGLPQYSLTDGALVDRGYEFDLFMNPIPQYEESTQSVATVTGACMWIPREVWDAVGGFPDWFGSIAEDIYICHAARLLGYSVTILEAPGFDHWIGRNLGGGKVMEQKLVSTVRRRALSERNKTWVMMICYPLPILLLVLPLHFTLLTLEAVALLLSGTGWSKVHSIYLPLPASLATNISKVCSTRNHIQRQRCLSPAAYLKGFRLVPWKLVMLWRHGIPNLHR